MDRDQMFALAVQLAAPHMGARARSKEDEQRALEAAHIVRWYRVVEAALAEIQKDEMKGAI